MTINRHRAAVPRRTLLTALTDRRKLRPAPVLLGAMAAVLLAAAATSGAAPAANNASSASAATAATAAGSEWPQFRGPHRDGIAPQAHLLHSWPAGGPRQLWQVPIGEGYSHLTVAGGRIFTLYGANNAENLAAYDAANGHQLWVRRTDSELMNDQGNGPRSTPTFDDGNLYVQSAQGKLLAVAAASGKVEWSHDLAQEFGAQMPTWGSSSSPLVEGDLLLVAAGGSGGRAAMAFDKHSGRVVWKALDDRPGYASPIALTAAGVRQAIFFTGGYVSGLAVADGRLLWRVPWETSYDVNAATPLFVAPDKLFVSSGYDTGSALFQIRGDARQMTAEPLWKSRGLKNQFSSSVLAGDYLYGFDNGTFKCIKAQNGEERWKERGLGHGSVILADGLLLVLSESGKLVLADAAPEAYHERGSFQPLSGRCWTGPSLAGGKLFLRNREAMAAYDVAAARP
ncbi:MAG TPA: PQQ-binding-like beta-propeller repeat protein [Thermoanaerobaculia bacterium]|nr:PQQ-binding-like beta-propeller repeat protein [Thermoanaerobaculia bacterium]